MTQSMTASQLREAVELGDDFLVGATTKKKDEKPYTVTCSFSPRLTKASQYISLLRRVLQHDDVVLQGLGPTTAVFAVSFLPSNIAALKPGKVWFKIGLDRSVSSVVIQNVRPGTTLLNDAGLPIR